ncbi:MAG: LCP family protein [Armatimonadetes bacterium]|nr:LCP family protein [Armatimonadota bacterium]
MDQNIQIYAPPPSPPHKDWGGLARLILPGIVVAFFGFALGAYISLAGRTDTFTGGRVVDRPATQQFSLLGLARRVNVLVIGTDVTLGNRRQILPFARADSLLLASFDPESDRITALSIPRDTRAAIPGVGTTKINAAYAFGGPGLTVRTVEDLLGVKIDFYVKLGPKSFARLVDAIGGVEVDVEKDMRYTDNWAGLHINLKKGRQVLNGAQAEGYIRFRHDALGDIGRVERQQKILLAIADKLRSPAMIMRAPQLIRAFTENTQTNLTLKEMMTLGMFAVRVDLAATETATLPGTFTPNYWEPDWPKVRVTVLDMFYGVSPEMLAETRIEVLNASGVPGLARRTAGRLERLGFRVVRVASAEETAHSLIIDRAGRAQVIRLLADLLGQPRIQREASAVEPAAREVDITVLLARDYASISQVPLPRR